MEPVYDALVDIYTATQGTSGLEWSLARAAVPATFNNTGTDIYGGAIPSRPEPRGTFRIPRALGVEYTAETTALRVVFPNDALHRGTSGLGWLVTEVRWAHDHVRLLTRKSVTLPQGEGTPVATNENPVAAFTYTADGLTVAFTDASTDADGVIASRSWTFGNGATSDAVDPVVTYAEAGTYTVGLTVTDDGGASHSTSQTVTVEAAPAASYAFLDEFDGAALDSAWTTSAGWSVSGGRALHPSGYNPLVRSIAVDGASATGDLYITASAIWGGVGTSPLLGGMQARWSGSTWNLLTYSNSIVGAGGGATAPSTTALQTYRLEREYVTFSTRRYRFYVDGVLQFDITASTYSETSSWGWRGNGSVNMDSCEGGTL